MSLRTRPLLGILEQLVRHAVIDASPHVKVLPGAVRLSAGILLDPLGARLVRVDELGALGLARLLEVGAGIHRVFVVGPVEWTGAVVSRRSFPQKSHTPVTVRDRASRVGRRYF